MNSLKKLIVYKVDGINYIGSTMQKLNRRQTSHISNCYNVKKKSYNIPLYIHIRDKSLQIKLIPIAYYFVSNKSRRYAEQYWIEKYDSKNNGLNTLNCLFNQKEYNKEYYEKNKRKEYYKKWYEKNKTLYFKDYYEKNKEKKKEYGKEYQKKNKEKIKEYQKEYDKKNKQKIKKRKKEYYEKNKEKANEWRKKNKQKIKKYYKEYREKNKEKLYQKRKEWRKKNPNFRKIKIICPKCNCLTNRDGLKRHQRSIKCKNFFKDLHHQL